MQTFAIFKDAYRELNHKKLFWVVLGISLAVVAALAMLSNDEKGFSVFGMGVDFPLLSTKAVSRTGFYKFLLFWIGNNLWLTWGAAILALISTAGMIPDMVTGGSIDLTLSRPISRLRLFLTKYAAGLLFVAMQTLVFAVGAVLLLGLRAGSWELRPLLAVPIVVGFYSYIYCICALVGLITRSTLAALLATLFFWLGVYAVSTVENVLLAQRLQREQEVTSMENRIAAIDGSLDTIQTQLKALGIEDGNDQPESTLEQPPANDNAGSDEPADAPSADSKSPAPQQERSRQHRGPGNSVRALLASGKAVLDGVQNANDPVALRGQRKSLLRQREQVEQRLPPVREEFESMRKWHNRLYAAATVLPKTGETKRLFQRYVVDKNDQEGFLKFIAEQSNNPDNRILEDALNERPLGWIVGTSLAFEAVILAIACWIFVRRDF